MQGDSILTRVKDPANGLLIIDNKIYDISQFARIHPGGDIIAEYLSKDASDAFRTFHDPSTYELLADFYVCDVPEGALETVPPFTRAMRDLRTKLVKEGWFETETWFYAWNFLVMVGLMVAGLVLLAASSMVMNGATEEGRTVVVGRKVPLITGDADMGVWDIVAYWLFLDAIATFVSSHSTLVGTTVFTLAAILVGLSWQQAGWFAHDLCHHQIFQHSRRLNAIGAYLIGGAFQGFSPAWWKDKHNHHHALTNIHHRDPDIRTMPLFAWSSYEFEDRIPSEAVKKQSWLFFPVLMIAQINWVIQSAVFSFTKVPLSHAERGLVNEEGERSCLNDSAMSKNALVSYFSPNPDLHPIPTLKTVPDASLERLAIASHHLFFLSLVFLTGVTFFQGAIFVLLAHVIGGLLIGLCFALNHCGMPIYKDEEAAKMGFYELQVVTGRDVTHTPFVDWFTGGLNYQIEHHLFPSLPRNRYPDLAPIVRDLCSKYAVPYHLTGFWEGMSEVLKTLGDVQLKARMVKED